MVVFHASRKKVSICCLQTLPSLYEVGTLLRDAFDGCFHREEFRTVRLLDLLVAFVLLLSAAAVSFISMGDQKGLDGFCGILFISVGSRKQEVDISFIMSNFLGFILFF